MSVNIINKNIFIMLFILSTLLCSSINNTLFQEVLLTKGFELDPGTCDGGGVNGPTIPVIDYPSGTDNKIKAEFIIIGIGQDQTGQYCAGAWEDAILWCMWASALFELFDQQPETYDIVSFSMNVHLLGHEESVNRESLFDLPDTSGSGGGIFNFDYHQATLQNIYDVTANVVENSDPNDLIFFIYSGHGYSYNEEEHSVQAYGIDEFLYDYNLKILFDKFACSDSTTTYESKLLVFIDSCFSGGMNEIMSIQASENVLMIAACRYNETTQAKFFNYMPDGSNYHGALTGYFIKQYWDSSSCEWINFDLDLENVFDGSV